MQRFHIIIGDITAKKSNELIVKLEQLTSRYNAQQLHREVYIADRGNELDYFHYPDEQFVHYRVDEMHDIRMLVQTSCPICGRSRLIMWSLGINYGNGSMRGRTSKAGITVR